MATPALEPRRQERTAYAQLLLLAVIWAINWPLVKVILPSVAPITLLVVRFSGATALAAVIAAALGQPLLPLKGERLHLGVVGLFQIAFVMALGTLALQYLGAGRATVMIYTMQLWALPLGVVILKERITPMGLIGGVIGFLGMVLFLNPMLVNWSARGVLAGNIMIIGSAIAWAIGSCIYRTRRWKSPLWTQVCWQCLWSTVAVLLLGWLIRTHHHIEWNSRVIAVLIFNWLLSTSAAYWLWNRALSVLPVAKAGQVVSLAPVLAVIISAVFMKESVGPLAVLSIGLIICGILVTLRGGRRARAAEVR